ncbi:M3 family metallopeptidase [Streptomyces olivaceus]|uniref:M3 family metallopeptidase n=1 Tax=Streptomyces olivaceus TaxID=47716 RepID=UPI001884E370|nr:M3 family metallopeptidase [Streptomyces olivaceus]
MAIEDSLDGMLIRLRTLLDTTSLDESSLVEIMSIYNNVAYIFLYLEAIDDDTNYRRLLPKRALFHDDPALDAKLLELATRLRCDEPEAEDARLELVDQLRKAQTYDPTPAARINELLLQAKEALDGLQDDQNGLLKRIGVNRPGANPSAVFYKIMARTESGSTRQKLSRTWEKVHDAHLGQLVDTVNAMVAVRWADVTATGLPNVLARSLERSRLSPDRIEPFLHEYIEHAVESHARLESEVLRVTGTAERPMDHFAFAMSSIFGKYKTPLFSLEECLEFIFAVTRSVFGLDLHRVQDTYTDVLSYDVRDGDREIGQIKFDLWNRDRKITGNHTRGIRNRTDWRDLTQQPVAYVACRFQVDPAGVNRITFQNVHSLFHEFGHAVNHLLIRKRLSYQSGLEYLPPERLECLSMWFEKWVYHPDFAQYLSLPRGDAEALARCCRIKMLEYRRTYVERAVTAALDHDIHSRRSVTLADAYARLDQHLGIGRSTRLSDFPAYFTWPMYVAKPGANFSYLWGSADSCQKFTLFQELSLDEIASRPRIKELFTSSFDFDALSEEPDPAAVFAFYDRAVLTSEE